MNTVKKTVSEIEYVQPHQIRYFFKKIFQQEALLKAFLNTVLTDELRAPITKLTDRPTEFIPHAERHALNQLKHAIIDVFVSSRPKMGRGRSSKFKRGRKKAICCDLLIINAAISASNSASATIIRTSSPVTAYAGCST